MLLYRVNNRSFHGLWRHLGWGANTAKITVNVWDFGPLGTAVTPLQRVGFPQRKCILKEICVEIIFMKYKGKIQVITTVNEFLKFHTNPSNQHYANYHEIRSHMRRFIIRIYRRRTFFSSLIFCWMNDINKNIWGSGKFWKSACLHGRYSGFLSGPKSRTFTVIFSEFVRQPRWRHKPWKGLFHY